MVTFSSSQQIALLENTVLFFKENQTSPKTFQELAVLQPRPEDTVQAVGARGWCWPSAHYVIRELGHCRFLLLLLLERSSAVAFSIKHWLIFPFQNTFYFEIITDSTASCRNNSEFHSPSTQLPPMATCYYIVIQWWLGSFWGICSEEMGECGRRKHLERGGGWRELWVG